MAILKEGTVIGQAYEKLKAINDAESVELNQSPGNIRDKYEARRLKVLAKLKPGIRKRVETLLAADADD